MGWIYRMNKIKTSGNQHPDYPSIQKILIQTIGNPYKASSRIGRGILSPHLNPLPEGEEIIKQRWVERRDPSYNSAGGRGGYYPLNYPLTLILCRRARR